MAKWEPWPGEWFVRNEVESSPHYLDWENTYQSQWLYRGAFPVQDVPGKTGSIAYGTDDHGWWVNQNFSPKVYHFDSTTPETEVRAFIEVLARLSV